MASKSKMKTLSVSEETHKDVVKLGTYGESMDDIIKRLVIFYTSHKDEGTTE